MAFSDKIIDTMRESARVMDEVFPVTVNESGGYFMSGKEGDVYAGDLEIKFADAGHNMRVFWQR